MFKIARGRRFRGMTRNSENMVSGRLRIIRLGLVTITFIFFHLHPKLHIVSMTDDHHDIRHDVIHKHNILEQTVNLLFMDNKTAANKYLVENPSLKDLKFYSHKLPLGVRTVKEISDCLESSAFDLEVGKGYPWQKHEFLEAFCDWGGSICTPRNLTKGSRYSTYRLNSIYDSVLARIFTDYIGAFRTTNATKDTLKIVPYPAWSTHDKLGSPSKELRGCIHERTEILALQSMSVSHLDDHLFLYNLGGKLTVFVPGGISKRPGDLVLPYVNTNLEYQPNTIISSMNPAELNLFLEKKRFALAAVFSKKISGNGYARLRFTDRVDAFFGNGTLRWNNGTLASMPVAIHIVHKEGNRFRNLDVGEAYVMSLYRESIFCPIFRGDTPDQKRFFDVILSGCIPVVMAHYWQQDGSNMTSYFAPGVPNHRFLPWALGSFGEKYPDMGVDFSKLVIEIDETGCPYLDCMPSILEGWLKDPAALLEKQKEVAKYARLFTYGLQKNMFLYVDAMSTLLVRARHYIVHETA